MTKNVTSAGGIVYTTINGVHHVVLVQRTDDEWVLPKGHWQDSDKTLEGTALREIFEETGLRPEFLEIERPIGVFSDNTFIDQGESKEVHIFLLHWTKDELSELVTDPDHKTVAWWPCNSPLPKMKYSYQETAVRDFSNSSSSIAKKIVITGGSCCGKTTVINELQKLGHTTVPEAAILVIDSLNKSKGIEGQKLWRKEHPVEFQIMITKKQVELEKEAVVKNDGPVFVDRGVFDGLAYCRVQNVSAPNKVLELIEGNQYSKAFVLDTLSNFEQRADTGRTSSYEKSARTRDLLIGVYQEKGIEVKLVQEMSVTDRVSLILANMQFGLDIAF